MEKKIFFSALFGALIISVGMLFVRMIVNYYDETGSFCALMAVPLVVYAYGVTCAIILHPFFKGVATWMQSHLKKRTEKCQK